MSSTPFEPLVSRPHIRMPWRERGCASIFIHGSLDTLRGASESVERAQYDAAKLSHNVSAAFDVLDRIWDEEVLDRLVDCVVDAGKAPIYAFPFPGFDEETDADDAIAKGRSNAIPYAFAERLLQEIGGEANDTILQSARVGRTKLTRMARMLFQPHFTGAVRTDRPYLLLDDTFTLGGTLAALRTYIIGNGGTVIGYGALAHRGGRTLPFALTPHTQRSLYRTFSTDIDRFWKDSIGHEATCLTDSEGCHLVDWAGQNCRGQRDASARLYSLGARLSKARASGE